MKTKTPEQWAEVMLAHLKMVGMSPEALFIDAREIMRECYANAASIARARNRWSESPVALAIEAEAKRLGL